MNSTMRAGDLRPGDRFVRPSYSEAPDIVVEVLKPREPYTDFFGREQMRYWCKRTDTGAEGWMIFGLNAVVTMAPERVTLFVRVGSHRARGRLTAMLGYDPRTYFSWKREGEWAEIPPHALDNAVKITGISSVRKVDDLQRCIKQW